MDADTSFIIDHLERKSNAILGFLVVQSIYLAEKLANEEFVQKIKGIKGLYNYIFFGHTLILVFGITFLFMIDYRISKKLDFDLKRTLQPHLTLIIKLVIAILFGLIPILVLIERINH